MVDCTWSSCGRFSRVSHHFSPVIAHRDIDILSSHPHHHHHRVDAGAYLAIQRKESGGRLLPAGVIRVEGSFASHQAVNLIVRRRTNSSTSGWATPLTSADSRPGTRKGRRDADSTAAGGGSSSSSVGSISKLGGSPNSGIAFAHHPASSNHFTAPGTPNICPALSLSSSIASLDALSLNGRLSVPQSPATTVKDDFKETSTSPVDEASAGVNLGNMATSPLEPVQEVTEDLEGAWEEFVIGKGLALYNSVEIDRVKGAKR